MHHIISSTLDYSADGHLLLLAAGATVAATAAAAAVAAACAAAAAVGAATAAAAAGAATAAGLRTYAYSMRTGIIVNSFKLIVKPISRSYKVGAH